MELPVNPDSLLDLPGLPNDLLTAIKAAASKTGINRIALVGGAVRDGILHKVYSQPWKGLIDLDLIVEGSALEVAKAIQKQLGLKRVTDLRVHNAYNTVEIKVDGFPIDLASARTESYSAPGKNPVVAEGNLEKDLSRRDFTVNAIAIEINEEKLLDPFDGLKALASRQLHFLHSKSVEEDPTRILRGARYAARLNFDLAPEAMSQVKATMKSWPWEWQLNESPKSAPPALSTRLRLELELLLKEKSWEKSIMLLEEWGGLLLLDQTIQNGKVWKRRLQRASRLQINPLTALVAGAKNSLSLAKRLQLPERQQQLLAEKLELEIFLSSIILEKKYLAWSPSRWCRELENGPWSPGAIAVYICEGGILWRPLIRWWGRWRQIKSPITPKELIQEGWQPGPELGAELTRLRKEILDQQTLPR